MTVIQSVTGPVDSADLGVCLPHEHIINDVRSWWQASNQVGIDPEKFAKQPVSTDILWELRLDPFSNLDNCQMDDAATAEEELLMFKALGGVSVLEATSVSIGRNLPMLRDISQATGLTVIAGTGFYLDSSQPESIKSKSVEEIAQLLLDDLSEGEEGVRPGFIGEIGVSSDFTAAERRSLDAASLVQSQTGLPMQIHLPGWFRLGHEVLDAVEAKGVDPRAVVLCHMGPSGPDQTYQQELAARGAFIQYDMIGMELFYADQGVQCPSDEENARHIMQLCNAGFAERVLLSQDIFLKSLMRRFGGPGFGHILQYFAPRLRRHGASDELIELLMVANPRRLFEQAKEIQND
jgi:phosphotriesterase-related protein